MEGAGRATPTGASSARAGGQIGLEGATGLRVELVESVRREADEGALRRSVVLRAARPRGMPTSFRTPVVRSAARDELESRARATPEIVGEAERRHGRNGRAVRDPELPADEWKAQTTEVDPERAAGVEARRATGGLGERGRGGRGPYRDAEAEGRPRGCASPERAASIVIRTSQPNPAATGKRRGPRRR